ncbi:MAG: formylglycine-generating enzyme family protein [Sphingomonadales bacterium]|nr:formylglycine-generating enzyme family protein [Sphingomonadales bacterium]
MTPGTVFRDCTECPEMIAVPAGEFMMGSPASEEGRSDDEGPQRKVTISKPFAVGKFEVTFAEWDACVAAGECKHKPMTEWGRGNQPVMRVSWDDAKQYVEWLSRKTGNIYRLLSEAEWEYAARAGTTTPFSTGPTITTDQANFDGDYTYSGSAKGKDLGKTIEAGSFKPNAFGLHDMHGNVWEWVEDCYQKDGYQRTPSDGSPLATGDCSRRVLRGGSWNSYPRFLRSADRYGDRTGYRVNNYGFRVGRTLAP